jgi:hypothetical protein
LARTLSEAMESSDEVLSRRNERVRSLARAGFWRFLRNATRTFFFFATTCAPFRESAPIGQG